MSRQVSVINTFFSKTIDRHQPQIREDIDKMKEINQMPSWNGSIKENLKCLGILP